MKNRIFRNMCAVALLCVLLCYAGMIGVLYRFSFDSMVTVIRDEAMYIEASLNNGDTSGLEATKATFTRVTLVEPDGTVIYDSKAAADRMENHADRPEIAGAIRSGAAEAKRYSQTLATRSYYRAVRLQNGQVVRVSGDMDSVWIMALKYMPCIVLVVLAAILASAVSARLLARRIAAPINGIDLEKPLSNDVYGELSPLLRRLNKQRLKIQEQLEQLEEKRREFDAITGNMREGLILLSMNAQVLSINQSALRALGLHREECVGSHILRMTRNEDFQRAVKAGLQGAAAEATLSVSGRVHQLICNPVANNNKMEGVVLLLFDVTEKGQAEQMRREFTANVSHELKTPLTSITGFAEIIKDGMAKPEDVPRFAGRIHNEAKRLIALVDDILRLSRLDEKSDAAPKEIVDLPALSEQVAERFFPLADEKGVAVEISGDNAEVWGIPHIMEEIVSNLLDNAIKYNRPGGKVHIEVSRRPDGVRLTVSDTGIGISKEHHERVFERFYRVDKCRSKETGGTGLGLSIVKHGALLHHARLELKSEDGEGTTIRLLFPNECTEH